MHVAIDQSSSVPPYEQLRSQVAAQVADGTLAAGTRLPTVRGLARELGLAVNTVARAYRELEADGVVTTAGRRGTVVSPGTGHGSGEAREAAARYTATARRLGLTLPEATLLLERTWTADRD